MKTKLLLVFLFAVHIAIAQNLVISEIMVNPSGSDSPHEYIEFRGDPGATIDETCHRHHVESVIDPSAKAYVCGSSCEKLKLVLENGDMRTCGHVLDGHTHLCIRPCCKCPLNHKQFR